MIGSSLLLKVVGFVFDASFPPSPRPLQSDRVTRVKSHSHSREKRSLEEMNVATFDGRSGGDEEKNNKMKAMGRASMKQNSTRPEGGGPASPSVVQSRRTVGKENVGGHGTFFVWLSHQNPRGNWQRKRRDGGKPNFRSPLRVGSQSNHPELC